MIRRLYTLLLYLLLPLVFLRLLWRSVKAPEYRRRWSERFGIFKPPADWGGLWVHAVSVGEVIAAVRAAPEQWYVSESGLNALGYRLMGERFFTSRVTLPDRFADEKRA